MGPPNECEAGPHDEEEEGPVSTTQQGDGNRGDRAHTIDEVKAEGRTRTNSQKGDHQAEKEGQVDVSALMRVRICFDSVVSVLRLYCRLDSEVTRLPLSLYVQYVIVPRIV